MAEHQILGSDSCVADENRKLKLARFTIGAELLFILLPLVVVSIVELGKGHTVWDVLKTPEWSFGAAVLFGQTTAKLVAGFSNTQPGTWEKPVFIVSAIIVICLVPSLIVMALILSISPAPAPVGLRIAQVIMFILGVFIFLNLGAAGQAKCYPTPNDTDTREVGSIENRINFACEKSLQGKL